MLPADRILLERLGGRLRELREAAGLSQEAVGERAGFGGKYIGEIEKGLRDVPISTLRAVIEHGLGLRVDAAFAGKGQRHVASEMTHPREVELTATLIAAVPIKLRRPLLALVRAIANEHAEDHAGRGTGLRAAERRGSRWRTARRR